MEHHYYNNKEDGKTFQLHNRVHTFSSTIETNAFGVLLQVKCHQEEAIKVYEPRYTGQQIQVSASHGPFPISTKCECAASLVGE